MQSVSSTIKKLIADQPFYGIFASGLTRTWSTQVDHMGIVSNELNYKLLINQKYWESLDSNHRLGLILHNILHMCFFHVTDMNTFKNYTNNESIIRLAMDLEVNSYLYEEWWPEDSSSDIFRLCPNLPKKLGTVQYIKILQQIISNDPNILSTYINDENTLNQIQGIIQHPVTDNTWEYSDNLTNLRRTQLEYRIVSVANSLPYNSLPSHIQETVGKLFTFKQSVFNWKKFFRKFLATAIDFSPKNTRRKESLRFPGATGQKYSKKHEVLIGVDTSGSIDKRELDEFFSEIYHVWKAGANITICEFDDRINKTYPYKGKTPEVISGRGGTDFHDFVNYYNKNRKKYTLGICFTDGYASLDVNPAKNFCWVISSNGDQRQNYPGYQIFIPKKVE